MALAGYLVLNNVRAAFVEIQTGVLICTPQLRKTRLPPAPSPVPASQLFQPSVSYCNNSIVDDNYSMDDCVDAMRLSTSSTDSTATSMSCSDASSDELSTGDITNNLNNERFALPLLARRCMLTKRTNAVCRHKPMRGDNNNIDDNDRSRYNVHTNNNNNDDDTATSHRGRARVVQLSGLIVEVLDAEHEFDTPPAYPFSFQVNTYTPSKRDADGNKVAGSSERVDSLVLSAIDARAKALWVKRIRLWNRYGWRETEFVNADDSDYFTLQARLLSDAPRPSCSAALSQAQSQSYDSTTTNKSDTSNSCSTVASSTRPTRRRFYRAPPPTSGLGLLVPP